MIKYECDICGKEVVPDEAYGVGVFPEGKPMTYSYKAAPSHALKPDITATIHFTAENTHNQFCGECAWKTLIDMVLVMAPGPLEFTSVKGMGEALAQEVATHDVEDHSLPDPALVSDLMGMVFGGVAVPPDQAGDSVPSGQQESETTTGQLRLVGGSDQDESESEQPSVTGDEGATEDDVTRTKTTDGSTTQGDSSSDDTGDGSSE